MKLKNSCAALLAFAVGALFMSGCEETPEPLPEVSLSVWCAAEDVDLINVMLDSFREEYADSAAFTFTVSEEGEVSAKETILSDIAAAADVFSFADDQFNDLKDAGALLEITNVKDEVIAANGGLSAGAIQAAMYKGGLYALPATASNGYFLYYNKKYFSDTDVLSFDSILDIAEKNGKKVTMDMTSGWYLYSFFKGAGLDVGLNEDRITNHCDWNASGTDRITGVQTAEAILKIVSHPAFQNDTNDAFIKGLEDGSVIAGINGTWNAKNVSDAFGEGYAAAKLPTFNVNGEQVQMHSFAGYKLIGVNAYSQNPEWAEKLAAWITNEENQTLRFTMRGEGPSNVNAAASPEVQADPAIAALSAQAQFSHRQDVASTYWTPTNYLGVTLSAGKVKSDELQALLDEVTQQITDIPDEAVSEQS